MARKYRANHGLSYPTKKGEKRAKPGDILSDLPGPSIKWLVAQGYVTVVDKESS